MHDVTDTLVSCRHIDDVTNLPVHTIPYLSDPKEMQDLFAAMLDLMHLTSGADLNMFNKIIKWAVNFSQHFRKVFTIIRAPFAKI